MNPVIIIPAYSRAESLVRLLSALKRAIYPPSGVKLIISLDGGATQEVINVAREFSFASGTVQVITREKNLGLREHILWCGDQSLQYGSVIVLEDDLYVDPYFYIFAASSLRHYNSDPTVAGIALYSPEFNEFAGVPFRPAISGLAVYLMQIPCSWGQAWTAGQWAGFRGWYERANSEHVVACSRLPVAVKRWPESSWKKYYAAYLVFENKNFIYPYISYSTNCSDAGGFHIKGGTDFLQVSMPTESRDWDESVFLRFGGDLVKYDSFMEPLDPEELKFLGLSRGSVEFDFYGLKPLSVLQEKEYAITSKRSSARKKSIPLSFRPVEKNLLHARPPEEDSVIALCCSGDISTQPKIEKILRGLRIAEYFSGVKIVSGTLLIKIALGIVLKKIGRAKFW